MTDVTLHIGPDLARSLALLANAKGVHPHSYALGVLDNHVSAAAGLHEADPLALWGERQSRHTPARKSAGASSAARPKRRSSANFVRHFEAGKTPEPLTARDLTARRRVMRALAEMPPETVIRNREDIARECGTTCMIVTLMLEMAADVGHFIEVRERPTANDYIVSDQPKTAEELIKVVDSKARPLMVREADKIEAVLPGGMSARPKATRE